MSSTAVPGITSPTKQTPTTNTKANRLPAPTLFVAPPSRNASQLSVSRTPIEAPLRNARDPLLRQKSALGRPYKGDADTTPTDTSRKDRHDLPTVQKPSEKSVDAKWREIQSTLNEVELTAQSSTQVFGASHVKALDELRQAQIALARAWGRGNEDQAAAAADNDASDLNVTRFKGADDLASERVQKTSLRHRADTDASGSTALSDEGVLSDGSGGGRPSSSKSGRGAMEDETVQDIRLASERRAANEAYFKKVDQGVKEVVEKLEKVAEAMRGVEAESRSLWSQSD